MFNKDFYRLYIRHLLNFPNILCFQIKCVEVYLCCITTDGYASFPQEIHRLRLSSSFPVMPANKEKAFITHRFSQKEGHWSTFKNSHTIFNHFDSFQFRGMLNFSSKSFENTTNYVSIYVIISSCFACVIYCMPIILLKTI